MAKNKKIKKVHLIGICGTAMSALAIIMKESGWQVTGTDEDFFGETSLALKKNGIKFFKKFSADNIPSRTDLVVLGNFGMFTAEFNPETRRAVEMECKFQSLPETLAVLAKDKEQIVVAGSFGKSSCASLLSWCLDRTGKNPSYLFAAQPIDLKNSGHLDTGKEFVIEGDEYSSSKTDKRSKFLHYNPSSVLLTSGEHDHANLFPTEESYKTTYKKLMAKIPKNGLLVYCLDGKNNTEISKHAKCKHVSYSLDNRKADWYAKNIKYGMQSSFDLTRQGKKVMMVKTKLLGKHNIENIIGVGALLLEQIKITPIVFAKAISSFHGIKKRMELKTKNSKVLVYEGFGPSYEKVKSVFDAMRLHFPKRRIIAVFEPHAFSWRNRKFLKWYRNIFDNVDEVITLPATGHGKRAKDQLTTREVWREIKKHRKNVYFIKSEKEGLAVVKKIIKKGDVVALVSSGPMFGLTESVPKLVEKMFRKR